MRPRRSVVLAAHVAKRRAFAAAGAAPRTSIHPKARGLNVRTLELLRVWGLEPAVRAAAKDLERALDVVWAPTLLAPESKRLPYGGAGARRVGDSPSTSIGCAHAQVEPLYR